MPKNRRKPAQSTGKKRPPTGKPFRKNDPETGEVDERINRTGQNRKFTEFHRMLDRLFEEKLPIVKDGKQVGSMSVLENMTRLWLISQDFPKQNKLLEYFVGKVPDVLSVQSDEAEKFIASNIDLLTDGQIERLGKGEDAWLIIGELLRDAEKIKREQSE